MFAVWSVALVLFAAVPAAKDGGSLPAMAPPVPAAPATSARPVASPHLCVRRSGGSRATKARPTYITVGYGGRPQDSIGSVVSKELKCFELAGGSFTVQLNSVARAAAAAPEQEACGDRIEVSGLSTGWIEVTVTGRPGTPVGCPWSVTSRRGHGPLPTLAPRPAEMVEKDFVVLPAIPSYADARRVASAAARRLGLKLDLRRARSDGHGGLTFSPADCEANDWEHPCYVARGRDDDGVYVSVDEARRFFDAEKQGYLVILASGPKNDPPIRAAAERAQALFPSAEVRTDDVWQGCIH
jgi:hypothetical protein